MIGKILENYKVLSLLGKGGMGTVYKAYDMKLDRYVAIKILNSQITDQPHFVERFKREAKNQAQLVHPNIVTVYGFIDTEDILGIVMEYIEGESLENIIYRQGRLHILDAVYVLREILNGIGYAHSKGFVHRDIKPSNILFSHDEGSIKIMDFGISKSLIEKGITKTSAKVGTVLYMSPEQIKGEDVTHQTDIYALGVTLYEMVKGQPPFDMESEYEVMEAHIKNDPAKIADSNHIPPEMDAILEKALAKKVKNRYQSCEDFSEDLSKIDKHLEKIEKMHTGKKKKKSPVLLKTYSVLGFIGFAAVLIALSYFVYGKVHQMLSNDELEKFKKYSFDTLFEENDLNYKLEKVNNSIYDELVSVKYNNDKIYTLSKNGVVFQLNDEGKIIGSDSINYTKTKDFCIFESGKKFVVGDGSAIFVKKKNDESWTKKLIGGKYSLNKIYFVDEMTGFILGNKGLLLKTNDGGNSWRRINTNTDEFLYDIFVADKNTCFISGWNGILLRSEDLGESWFKLNGFTENYLKSLYFENKQNGFVVGGSGDIFLTENRGGDWEKIENELNYSLNKIFKHKDKFIVIGNKGVILSSKDKSNWKKVKSNIHVNLNDMTFVNDTTAILVGKNGSILKLTGE